MIGLIGDWLNGEIVIRLFVYSLNRLFVELLNG